MEKLQPVIAQRFWIAFGAALIMCLVGWWIETSASATLIQERESKIKSAVSAASIGGGVPNNDWKDALAQVNEKQQAELDKAAALLWEKQQAAKTWPQAVAPYMSGVEYRGKIADSTPLDLYRNQYRNEIRRLLLAVDAFDIETKKGKVLVNEAILPQVPRDSWRTAPPTWKEMWVAQEDVWLTRGILDSIRRLNESADGGIRDAPLREISRLELRGGNREAAAAGGGGDAESSAGSMESGGEEGAFGGGSDYEGGGSGGNMFSGKSSRGGVDFSADEELGSAAETKGSSSEGEDEASSEDESESSDSGGGQSMAGGGSFGFNSAASGKRYVDDDPSSPFKTRGFYLKVKIRHDMVPELIAELTESSWPVEILRVHQQDIQIDEVQPARGSSSSSSYPGSSGNGFSGAGTGSQTPGSGFGTPGSGFGTPGSGFGTPGSGFGTPGSGFGTPGSTSNFGGTSGEPGGEAGGFTTDPSAMEGAEMVRAALDDPNLVEVVVVGLMTIYMPPKVDESEANGDPNADGGGGVQVTDPSTESLDDPGFVPEDETQPGTNPAPAPGPETTTDETDSAGDPPSSGDSEVDPAVPSGFGTEGEPTSETGVTPLNTGSPDNPQ